jgi:glycosyltransferase involved in cell wall biosynthesis
MSVSLIVVTEVCRKQRSERTIRKFAEQKLQLVPRFGSGIGVSMPTLGLSMIVKNEAETIGPCLESVRGIASQIVIVDTGSTDDTVANARKAGATVLCSPWENHFASARNTALAPITTDWVLSLDADEELDRDAAPILASLLRKSDVAGYVLPVRNYAPVKDVRAGSSVGQPNDSLHPRAATAGSYFIYEKCRLFRRDPRIHFTGRVHEQVEVTIRAASLHLRPADLCIHNFGLLLARENMGRKTVFYRDLLRMRVKEEPDDFRGWTYLGRMEYDSFNNRSEALRCFQRALELNPRCVEALLFTAMIHLDLGRGEQALPFLDFNPPDQGSALQKQRLLGDAYSQSGQLEKARDAYKRALKLCAENPELESKLGLIEVKLGLNKRGIPRLEHVSTMLPPRVDVHDRLMKAYMLANMLPEAAAAAERLSTLAANPRAFLRAASIRAHLKQWEESKRLLERGLELFPDAVDLLAAHSESVRHQQQIDPMKCTSL